MPRADEASRTGAVGVTITQLATESELGWIFRRIEHRDTGLDAEVEVVIGGEATGMLLGLQIKSGASYFRESTEAGWRYRGDFDHLEYWREHNLGAIVVLVNPELQIAYWVSVGEDALVDETTHSWTIEVPRAQVVSGDCLQPWMNLAWASSGRDALFRYCGLHAEYIRHLAADGRLFVVVEEWANKTRGQAHFDLLLISPDGGEQEESFGLFAGVDDVADFLAIVFPWSTVDVDEDFYEEHEDLDPAAVFQDSEEPGGYHLIDRERPTGVRPYGGAGGGEVLLYRLELRLNELGRAYVVIEDTAKVMGRYPPHATGRAIKRMTKSSTRGHT